MQKHKLKLNDRETKRAAELQGQGDTLYIICTTLKDEFQRLRNRPNTHCLDAIEKALGIKKINYKRRNSFPKEASTGDKIIR